MGLWRSGAYGLWPSLGRHCRACQACLRDSFASPRRPNETTGKFPDPVCVSLHPGNVLGRRVSVTSRGRTRAPGLAREGPGSGGIIATFQSWRLLLAGFSRPCWLGSGASPSAHEELSLIWCLEEQVVAPIAPSTDLPLPHHPNLLSCFIPPRSHGPQTVHLPEVPTQREKWT